MTEWWTYGLSDFLMFSPQAYWRLLERTNAAWWPAQALGMAAVLALPVLLRRGAARTALLLLAAAWAGVSWGFWWRHYAEIFLAAPWLAGAGAVQVALLLAAALAAPQQASRPGGGRAATLLILLAAAWPLLAPLAGHPWTEAEVFGILPDPTAAATLGALLALRGLAWWLRALLAVFPVAVLLLGAATRWLVA